MIQVIHHGSFLLLLLLLAPPPEGEGGNLVILSLCVSPLGILVALHRGSASSPISLPTIVWLVDVPHRCSEMNHTLVNRTLLPNSRSFSSLWKNLEEICAQWKAADRVLCSISPCSVLCFDLTLICQRLAYTTTCLLA